jgi:PEP-CTERM motif
MRRLLTFAAAAALCATAASADDFSFTGTLTQDDQVLIFNFVVGAPSLVTLNSLSYAGGTNANGQVIGSGGFDPILALFDSSGALINQDDDSDDTIDPSTGRSWDVFLQAMLDPGTYSVAIMEYDNFANGPNLSDGFERTGQGNFTASPGFTSCPAAQPAFNDVSDTAGCGRTGNWAFDILGVQSAVVIDPTQTGNVPEPSTWAMMLFGFGALGCAMRRRKQKELRAV